MALGTTATIALLGAGAGVQAAGHLAAGRDARRAADFNAQIAEVQAQDALARGALEETRFRAGLRRLMGSQRAGYAAQGVDVTVGSPVDVQADTAYLGEMDALTIRSNAMREAWGYRVQTDNFKREGAAASRAAGFGAAGTILGTAGSIAMTKYGFTNA